MLGLRSKILIGFASLLLVVLLVSILAETVMEHYSQALRRSFREDYDSVVACQRMKEVIEQMDFILQRSTGENDGPALKDFSSQFDRLLAMQRQVATLPGEPASTENLGAAWMRYQQQYPRVLAIESGGQRRNLYLEAVLPESLAVRAAAQKLIDMNMESMVQVPGKANATAQHALWAMRALTVSGAALALLISILLARLILGPVRALTQSAHAIESGNLDLVVPIRSNDELGVLAKAFNTMAARLRSYRQTDHERLMRTERTTQLAIDSIPDPVLVINPTGNVELANNAARRLLGLQPGDADGRLLPWLNEVRGRTQRGQTPVAELDDYESTVQLETDGQQRHFLVRTAPIMDESGNPIGATIVLADVTGLRRLDEMKNSLLSLVSHELKTPLTSARMVLHLVTEQKVGSLTAKQLDLLSAARDDADRLHQIVENLLDMSRIESGRALMELRPIATHELVRNAIAPLSGMFQSQNVALEVALDPELPAVLADATRIGHVFANLLTNSLRHTPADGVVRILAHAAAEHVEFTVQDSGCGIPRQYLHRVFEKFFRVPGQSGGSGSGLGLAVAKDIIEAHRGNIRAESNEGSGTLFAFTLPRAGAVPHPVTDEHVAALDAGDY